MVTYTLHLDLHPGGSFNNCDIAQAMDKLGRLVPEEKPGPDGSSLHRKRREAQAEYRGMSQDEQFAWMDSLAKYPSIERAIEMRNAGRHGSRPESTRPLSTNSV